MKAHIARNQYAGIPTLLLWNINTGDRGKLAGIAGAFRNMRILVVQPQDAGCTVAQLLGDAAGRNMAPMKQPADTPAILMANFKDKEVDSLLALCRQMEVYAPLKALATDSNRRWAFAYLLEHLAEEHAEWQARQKP